MSPLEKRARLVFWSMCPAYFVYFAIQFGYPSLLQTMLERFAVLASVATVHAVIYVVGLLLIKRHENDEGPFADERDRAIDAHATRVAYFVLLAGMTYVGMVLPFTRSGWEIVNAALLVIVLTETLRPALILSGYRSPRFAH